MRTRLLVIAVVALVASASGASAQSAPDPREAAKSFVAKLEPARARAHDCAFGASQVAKRHGRFWMAVSDTCVGKDDGSVWPLTRVRVFRWSDRHWRLDGTVTGRLSGGQWLEAAALTGTRAPDFTVTGCGAGGTTCMSVVSKASGRWRAVPFEYGYGTSLVVDGGVDGHLVLTNAASTQPATLSYHRYADGVFVPADPPGRAPECTRGALEQAAGTQGVRFTHVVCDSGWAVAVGDGGGFAGQVVGLFEWNPHRRAWKAQTVDNGRLLPTAPSMFDLPLTLLSRLTEQHLAPELAAARLIATLLAQHPHLGYWPGQNGIVDAGGRRWLIAAVPDGPDPDASTHAPATASIHRWDGTRWVLDGQLPNLPQGLNVSWRGGWFIPVPQPDPSAVAFRLVGACCAGPDLDDYESRGVLTNAGGSWHVHTG